jgi:tRNA dimethylallyltransferase
MTEPPTAHQPAPALAIVGPTASGKSEVAMAWCRQHPAAEIVVVDALQVYRGMDIGTAKPSPADRAAVPHHCLDLAEPATEFSLTKYLETGRGALAVIAQRHGTPVLVAGTGLYLRHLIDPMEVPGRFPEIRRLLEQQLAAEGAPALHHRLAELDPLAASRMEPSNGRRVVRALEVCLGAQRPFSSFGPGLQAYPPSPVVQVGLRWPRPLLAERIERRVHTMIEHGLVAEVEGLLARPAGMSRTARQGLGYKEIIDHLEGRRTLAEATDEIVLRTRQYAVRQERWFRRDPRLRWVDIVRDPVAEAMPVILESWPH